LRQHIDFYSILAHSGDEEQTLAPFALLSLGIVASLRGGAMDAANAVRLFFHADNCIFVKRKLRSKMADEIMSRGVQLPDLFESLPVIEAQREFQRELDSMRMRCLDILEGIQIAA
jgi:hypothetical protein